MQPHQRAERHLAFHDAPAAESDHRRAAQHHEQARGGGVEVAQLRESLAGRQLARLMAGPAGEEVVIGRRRLQRVDGAQRDAPETRQNGALALHVPLLVGPPPRHRAHRERAGRRDGGDGEREQRIDSHQHGQEQRARDDLDDDSDELRGSDGGHLVDELDARRQLAGETMHEVADRQAEEMRQQALGLHDGQPDGQPPQTALLQPRQQVQGPRRPGGRQREEAPALLPASKHLVDEEAQQKRQREARQDHQQPARHRERQRRPGVAQPRPELAHDAGRGRPPGRKSGPGSSVSTTPVNFLSNSSALTLRRPFAGIVQVEAVRPAAF